MLEVLKEIGDQAAHLTVGTLVSALLTIGAMFVLDPPALLAVGPVGTVGGAALREYLQSPARKREGLEWCGSGCRLDMLFWTLGGLAGVPVGMYAAMFLALLT